MKETFNWNDIKKEKKHEFNVICWLEMKIAVKTKIKTDKKDVTVKLIYHFVKSEKTLFL